MKPPQKLYHGTCQAFLLFSQQNDGKFGPDYDNVSFTPQKKHAQMFADSWQTGRGQRRLQEFFGERVDLKLTKPVVLEFSSNKLGSLQHRQDCGADEYFRSGPIQLAQLEE